MKILAKVLILGTMFLGVSSAQASVEVFCKRGDCFRFGWEAYDDYGRLLGHTRCNGGDCETYGWTEYFPGTSRFNEVVCERGGCWKKGWQVRDSYGRWVADVTCKVESDTWGPEDHRRRRSYSDCLSYGWWVDSVNRSWASIDCIRGQCDTKGWRTGYSNGRRETTRCKENSCFNCGWIVNPSH